MSQKKAGVNLKIKIVNDDTTSQSPGPDSGRSRGSSSDHLHVGFIAPNQSPGAYDAMRHSMDDELLDLQQTPTVKDTKLPPRTKIVCTLGPSSSSSQTISKMIEAGMNVIRLNFSHGTQDGHLETMRTAREVMLQTRRLCAILLDTKGPEIRTGTLVNGKSVMLKRGQRFDLRTDETIVGDSKQVAVEYTNITKVLKKNDRILIDDGLIALKVMNVDDSNGRIECVVENDGELGQRKGVNLPGVKVDLPAVTQKDVSDIKFGIDNDVDFVAASFVRTAENVERIRSVLGKEGSHIKIIAKIECREALDNIDEIIEASDGIMVARGDLGVEIPIDQLSIAQKMIIAKCNQAGKFVITATQMLESMIENPSPTRAEASDVANAVFDGTDCVMLSGETAKGKYPVESVGLMAKICREAEAATNYRETYRMVRLFDEDFAVPHAIAAAAVRACFDLKAGVLIVLSQTGRQARLVAKYRPPCPIIAITANEIVARQSLASKSVFPLLVGSMMGTESLTERALITARQLGMISYGDHVVVTAGTLQGITNSTNMLKIIEIDW